MQASAHIGNDPLIYCKIDRFNKDRSFSMKYQQSDKRSSDLSDRLRKKCTLACLTMTLRQGVAAILAAAVTVIAARGDDAPPEPGIPVKVQPVRLALDDGSEAVAINDFYGLEKVAEIWAAAGIQVSFLAPIQLNSTEFYDLTLRERYNVMERKPEAIKTLFGNISPDTIVALFVHELGEACGCQRYNGWGNVPGTLLIVDSDGPKSPDTSTAVLAHEIGHNLSLEHASIDGNLMGAAVSQWMASLNSAQIAVARKTAKKLATGPLVSQPPPSAIPRPTTIPGNREM
ncbi:MAG: hypothetical protein ACI9R3_002507 [Verrucomicrobiales bacterium]|jgi:hypothetical protein